MYLHERPRLYRKGWQRTSQRFNSDLPRFCSQTSRARKGRNQRRLCPRQRSCVQESFRCLGIRTRPKQQWKGRLEDRRRQEAWRVTQGGKRKGSRWSVIDKNGARFKTEPHFSFVYAFVIGADWRSKGLYRSSSVQPFWAQRSRRVATRSALVLLSTTILSM